MLASVAGDHQKQDNRERKELNSLISSLLILYDI
jgi:hypothetical protein